MTKPKYKPGYMCINHPGEPAEFHRLYDSPSHMFFEDGGSSKLAIEHGSDWIDLDDSEFIGESETILRIWGLPVTSDEIQKGRKSISPPVTSDVDEAKSSDVIAWWFATVGHRVDKLTVDFPGQRRLRICITIPDITEETDDSITQVTFEFKLAAKETELEHPQ